METTFDENISNIDVYGKSYLGGGLIAATFVVTLDNIHYFYPPQISGYKIFSAINGDWKAWNGYVDGIVWQNETNSNIIFLNEPRTGSIRINALYIKTNW